ncbi:MAG: hypothetical protein QOI20_2847 [Acidimicrobiaceae bacterium]|nr:hypothetical protein [Acidimicrobiaceae bacterium]
MLWRPALGPYRGHGLPGGVDPLPGPALLLAAHYADSPIGPFSELAVAEPARLGLRPGFCVTTSVVAASECRVDYRLNWGVPAEVGTLLWDVDVAGARTRRLTWVERGIVVSGRPTPMRTPAWLPVRGVQGRADGAILVPRRVWGWLSLTRVWVGAPDDDPLAWAAGGHLGGVMTGMRMVVDPARHPAGLLSSLRAPLQAPGTGLTASVGREAAPAAARVAVPRAYGSVG